MLDNREVRKILLLLSFLLLCLPSVNFVSAESEKEWICIANYCYIYSSPSFTSEKVVDENSDPIIVRHKDILILEEGENGLNTYEDSEGQLFYAVLSVNNTTITQGYIFSDFVTENISNIETYPTFNATLKNDVYLYEATGEEITPTETLLVKGSRVYLYEGYNSSLPYTRVAVKVENSLEYGYIKTEEISPDGINPAIIYAITIALACIGIIMAFLFMKNKNKKKKMSQ